MEKTIKVKDLTLGFLEETCRKHDCCYQCPLDKLGIPCFSMPHFDDEQLEQEIKIKIEIEVSTDE